MGNIFSSGNQPERLFGVKVNSSELGKPVPVAMGCVSVPQNIFWIDGFKSRPDGGKKGTGGGGKGGGKGDGQYLYSANVIAGLCAGPIIGIGDMWTGQSWLGSPKAAENYTIESPYTYTPTNSSSMMNDYGVSPASTYSASYNDYSAPGSTSVSNTTSIPFAKVAYGNTLTTGQYSVSPQGVYNFAAADVGKTVTLAYSFVLTSVNEQETDVVPSSLTIPVGSVEVDDLYHFASDIGVVYAGTGANSGTALTRVSGTPTAAGTYSVSGSGPANYRFSSQDLGAEVTITYQVYDRNAVGQNQSTILDFTIAEGYVGQAPYSFLSGSYPGAAIGYSGVATVLYEPMDLGVSGEPQENRFEVVTPGIYGGVYANGGPILDCNPVYCMVQVLTNTQWGLGVGAIPFPAAFIDSAAGGTWGAPGTPGVQSVDATAWTWFASNSFFISPILDSQDTAASAMSKWLEAGMCAAFVSEGLLKLVPYGDTTQAANGCTWTAPSIYVAALDDTNFIAKEGADPVTIKRSAWQDAFNTTQVQWDNRNNQYASEITQESDQSLINRFGSRIEDAQSWDFIHTLTAATVAANLRLKHGTYIRNTYEFTLPFTYSFLEPMDLVTLTTSSVWAAGINNTNLGVTNLPVRILKIVDDPVSGLKIEAEDYPFGAGAATLFNKGQSAGEVVSNPYASPGSSEVVLFEAAGRLVGFGGNQVWMGATGTSADYGSTNVWVSQDNVNFVQVAQITSPAVLGTLAQELPVTADPDTTSPLVVQLVENSGPLVSGTTEASDNDTMLCYVDGEVISYSAAAVTGLGVWTMDSYIRRGQLGTKIGDHAIGSLFLRLDGSIVKYTYDPTWQGKTIYFKFQAVNSFGNNPQPLSSLSSVAMTLADVNSGAVDASTGLLNSPLAQQVTNVTSSESAYKTGTMQSLVAIDFTPVPNDPYFGAVDIYFTGYNGNPLPQLMSNVSTAPAEFLCQTTGETVTVTAVSVSLAGHESSFSAAPTTTVTLNGVTTAPPYPSIRAAQSALPGGSGWQFVFNVIGGLESDLISGYRIYHAESASSTSPAYYETKVQPPTNVGTITVQEVTGDLLWYWVSTINTSGLESELIAVPFQYVDPGAPPPNTTPVTTTQTYSPSLLLNGWAAGAHVQYCETQDATNGTTFSTCTLSSSPYNSPNLAYDGNQSTACSQSQRHNAEYAGVVWTFAGDVLPAGATITGATLSVVSDVQATAGISGEASMWYSTNGGSTWTAIYTWNAHNTGLGTRAKQTDTVTLPVPLTLANLQVMANFHSHDDLQHDIYEISLAVTGSSVSGPEAVTGVAASLVSGNIQISWNGLLPLSRTDIMNYQIYRATHGAGYTLAHLEDTVPATGAASYSWTDLEGHDGSWDYWVIAQNLTGFSPASHVASLYSSGSVLYSTGQTAEDLRPAARGADVTSQNVAADTSNVGGVASATVLSNVSSAMAAAAAAVRYNVTSINANYTASAWDVVLVTTTSGNLTITLPLSTSNTNTTISVKKVSADANHVTVVGTGSETIDGDTGLTILYQHSSCTLVSNGVNGWDLI